MKYGASTSYRHNAAAMRAAREEREAQERQAVEATRKRQRSLAQRAVLKATSVQKGRDLQYVDDDFKVKVKSGYHRENEVVATDIIIIDRLGPKGSHWHIIIDEYGNILHQGWRND
jgi:hypothetical protein